MADFETRERLEAAVTDFVAATDERVRESMLDQAYGEVTAGRLASVWTMANTCKASILICESLVEQGFDADLIVNKEAWTMREIEFEGGTGAYTDMKHHALVRVSTEGEPLYVDGYWQQFFRSFGVTIEETLCNEPIALRPSERVLIYEAGDVEDIAHWFASNARTLQDKIARRVSGLQLDTFSRPTPTLTDFFLGRVGKLPIEYIPVAEIEDMARRIWDPQYFGPITADELGVLGNETTFEED